MEQTNLRTQVIKKHMSERSVQCNANTHVMQAWQKLQKIRKKRKKDRDSASDEADHKHIQGCKDIIYQCVCVCVCVCACVRVCVCMHPVCKYMMKCAYHRPYKMGCHK